MNKKEIKIYLFGMGNDDGVKHIHPVLGWDYDDAIKNYINVLCSLFPLSYKKEEFWTAGSEYGYANTSETIDLVEGYDVFKY
jgi:hypothetical protein